MAKEQKSKEITVAREEGCTLVDGYAVILIRANKTDKALPESSSGKSSILASTSGFKSAEFKVNGKAVSYAGNVIVKK